MVSFWSSLIVGALTLLVAVYVATDPFQHSLLAGVGKSFQVQSAPLTPISVLAALPRDYKNKLQSAEIKYGGQVFGPESVAFDPLGRGPYAGCGDGRVMRWESDEKGWVEFAVVIANRTEMCNQRHLSRPNIESEALCGRPLGLRFHKQTGELYIADAYFGLMKVGPEGGVAELLTNEDEEGRKFVFTNDLDLDYDGTVYFTDTSTLYQRKDFMLSLMAADCGGRLLKWDPITRKTTVLVKSLFFANGVTFNKDHSFLVFAETTVGRLSRYWVKGPRAGSIEDFAWLPGFVDNVRTNDDGEFWVALHSRHGNFDAFSRRNPRFKKAFLRSAIPPSLYLSEPTGLAYKLNEEGEVVDVLEDQSGKVVKAISEIEEHDGKLYLGSVTLPHVAVYTLPK